VLPRVLKAGEFEVVGESEVVVVGPEPEPGADVAGVALGTVFVVAAAAAARLGMSFGVLTAVEHMDSSLSRNHP
jgi:hypothetical protein